MKGRTVIVILLLIFSCSEISFAQSNLSSGITYDAKELKPTGCELNSLYLDGANQEAEVNLQDSGRLQTIILIARPGIKDRKKGLNTLIERRLYTTRAYLTDYLRKQPKEAVVTAQAPNNGSEYGVIEIYVSGVLNPNLLVIYPNAGIGVGSCESEDSDDAEGRTKRALLYPWLYNFRTKKNSNKK